MPAARGSRGRPHGARYAATALSFTFGRYRSLDRAVAEMPRLEVLHGHTAAYGTGRGLGHRRSGDHRYRAWSRRSLRAHHPRPTADLLPVDGSSTAAPASRPLTWSAGVVRLRSPVRDRGLLETPFLSARATGVSRIRQRFGSVRRRRNAVSLLVLARPPRAALGEAPHHGATCKWCATLSPPGAGGRPSEQPAISPVLLITGILVAQGPQVAGHLGPGERIPSVKIDMVELERAKSGAHLGENGHSGDL